MFIPFFLVELLPDDGNFCAGDLKAHQPVIGIEEQQDIKIRGGYT